MRVVFSTFHDNFLKEKKENKENGNSFSDFCLSFGSVNVTCCRRRRSSKRRSAWPKSRRSSAEKPEPHSPSLAAMAPVPMPAFSRGPRSSSRCGSTPPRKDTSRYAHCHGEKEKKKKKVFHDFFVSKHSADVDWLLSFVKCTVISVMNGSQVDAYLLSESSLFIYGLLSFFGSLDFSSCPHRRPDCSEDVRHDHAAARCSSVSEAGGREVLRHLAAGPLVLAQGCGYRVFVCIWLMCVLVEHVQAGAADRAAPELFGGDGVSGQPSGHARPHRRRLHARPTQRRCALLPLVLQKLITHCRSLAHVRAGLARVGERGS